MNWLSFVKNSKDTLSMTKELEQQYTHCVFFVLTFKNNTTCLYSDITCVIGFTQYK